MNLFGEVEPVKAEPIAPYLGGKSQLAKSIVGRIQQTKHTTFVDVFFGMGGVFFRRVSVPTAEVINDINSELVTLFRVLRSHPEILLQELSVMLAARTEFDALKKADPTHMTDIQRAVRFYYLQRLSFGGKSTGRSFGVSPDRPSRFDINQLRENLRLAASRLSSVTIENLDWREVLSRYDSAGTLFYLDPPYWGGEADYGKGVFERKDFAQMAELLSEIRGRFLLSINDREEVRTTFEGFNLEQVHLNYSIGKETGKKVAELIISN
ncbi:DNA adenine methylase [Pseudovibrio sp. WM33]|uniref:DNA adenine methylase n=1 Tax=Pseudovibrio sp. WM33 TaxID=1735585 RepID=UPI0007AE9EAE|nr:DNA adenine methylase [Pseudovibrio sp. WM33]KZL17485.1 Modification methylase DpnIIA [Pseudovibrio sp. WM33]